MTPAGLEPAIPGSVGRCLIHWATGPVLAPTKLHMVAAANSYLAKASVDEKAKWTHWDLNPGPSACEADVIPLHHVPDKNGDPKDHHSSLHRDSLILAMTLAGLEPAIFGSEDQRLIH